MRLAEEKGAGEVLKAEEVVPLDEGAAGEEVRHGAANFDAEQLPLATSIFKGMDYSRQKGPPESLRVRAHCSREDCLPSVLCY